MSKRHCYWPGCNCKVEPSVLCCRDHWYKIPKPLRDRVWDHYRPGQESDGLPSREYVIVLREIRAFALAADGKAAPAAKPADKQGSLFG